MKKIFLYLILVLLLSLSSCVYYILGKTPNGNLIPKFPRFRYARYTNDRNIKRIDFTLIDTNAIYIHLFSDSSAYNCYRFFSNGKCFLWYLPYPLDTLQYNVFNDISNGNSAYFTFNKRKELKIKTIIHRDLGTIIRSKSIIYDKNIIEFPTFLNDIRDTVIYKWIPMKNLRGQPDW